MKAKYFFMMAASTFLLSNCSQEETLNQVQGGTKTLTATIEGSSRSTVTDGGVFSWSTGDAISVWNGENFVTFTNTEGNNFTTEETEPGTPTGYAIYPANENHNIDGTTVTVNLPATYGDTNTEYAANTNAPMLATIGTGNNTLAFKHLGGVMRFVVKDVPSTVTSFKFTANKVITGNFTVSDDTEGNKVISVGNESQPTNGVTIYFKSPTESSTMTFYVPLPVGEYGDYTVTVGDKPLTSNNVTNTIARGTLLLMPVYTYTDNGLEKDESGSYVAMVGGEQNLATGDGEVRIDATGLSGEEAVLNLNYTPSADNAELTISDGSDENVESTESVATVNVNLQSEEEVKTLNINAPTLTVNLASGTYATVNAKTATQTLIIGEGVNIETLTLNGGALQVAEGATIDKIIVKDELGLNSAVAIGKATLGADIDLTGTLWIGNDCEIDLNDHYIKNANGTTIKVKSGKKLTIGGEGTNSIVESTHSGGAAIWNMAGTLVINSGTYKNVASGAATIYCDRINDDNSRKGTWNLTINGGEFIGQNFTAVSLQNNRKNDETGYIDGKATIKGGTFNGGGSYYDLYLANVIVDITASSCTFTNNKVYLLTQGTNIDNAADAWGSIINDQEVTTNNGYIAFNEARLNAAVERGGKVILGANIDLSSTLWIVTDCEIDLNGHYIKNANGTAIKVKSGKTLTIGGEGESSIVESTHSAGAAIWNMAGTLNINSGTYKNVASGAATIYCDRINDDGTTRKGTWNLTIDGGTFIGQNFTAVSLQNNRQNDETGYTDGKATINGGTFIGGGSFYDLYLANVIADITASSCTFTNNKVYLLTQGTNIDNAADAWGSIINGEEITENNGTIDLSEN